MKVSTVGEMRRLDARAIAEFGIPDHLLMENAGQAVYYAILRRLGVKGRRFVVIAGPGNNGGDGFVVARKLRSTGAHVRVLVLADPSGYAGAAGLNYALLVKSGAQILIEPGSEHIAGSLAWCEVVVDGLLGTGLTRDVGGLYREVIERVNASGRPVFAIDIPSGVDGDTGQVRGVAVRADTTVTFGLPKRGNLLSPGAELGGRLVVTHISFPSELTDAPEIEVSVSEPSTLPQCAVEPRAGSPGEVLLVAGAHEQGEAAALVAVSLFAVGGVHCRLATPGSAVSRLVDLPTEIGLPPQAEAWGSLAPSALEEIVERSRAAAVVVLGPGLSPDRETQELVRRLSVDAAKPLVICGDGMTALSLDLDSIRSRAHPTVLILSSGELSRLAGRPTTKPGTDTMPMLQEVAEDLRATIVLEGQRTLIGLPDRRVYINSGRFPGTASSESRAVLAGTIAALCTAGVPFEEAVRTGVFLHAFAGKLAARDRGNDGIDARAVAERIPDATKAYGKDYHGATAEVCGAIEVI